MYFKAREQLIHTKNAFMHLRAEREYEREELLLDEFDLICAYEQKLAEVARLLNILYKARTEVGLQQMQNYNIRMVTDNFEEFARTLWLRSI